MLASVCVCVCVCMRFRRLACLCTCIWRGRVFAHAYVRVVLCLHDSFTFAYVGVFYVRMYHSQQLQLGTHGIAFETSEAAILCACVCLCACARA